MRLEAEVGSLVSGVLLVAAIGLFPGSASGADPTTQPFVRPLMPSNLYPSIPPLPATNPAAGNPATEPTAQGSPKRVAEMTRWFEGLNSADAPTRDSAHDSLMGLSSSELKVLRKLVADRRPLAPSQAAVLREVVTQAFLSGLTYDRLSVDGFLGVRPIPVSIGTRTPDPHDVITAVPPQPVIINNGGQLVLLDPEDPGTEYGMLVNWRMPGFSAARWLHDGDIILGIVERPTTHVRNSDEFSATIRSLGAGNLAHFVLLRQAAVIHVPIVLSSRPRAADTPTQMDELVQEREKAVEEYWNREFAPLLQDGPS